MIEWMILPLKRYAQFSGRSQRKEYWLFVLFSTVVRLVLNLVDTTLGLGGHVGRYATQSANAASAGVWTSGGVLSGLWSLAVLLPTLAVAVRRLHDINRSGWWLVAPVIPFLVGILAVALHHAVGAILFVLGGVLGIVLLVWACLDGTAGTNRFGPDPKGGFGDLEETFR